MVDKLLYADEKKSCCVLKSRKGIYLWKKVFIPRRGWWSPWHRLRLPAPDIYLKKKIKPVPVGYIGSVQKLEVTDWPPANAEITMEINLLTNILQVSLVSGLVKYRRKNYGIL